MAPRRLGWVLLAALLACASVASAQVPPIAVRVERADVEPYVADLMRVRMYANVVKIEGGLIDDVKPEELVLQAGNARLKHIPGIARYQHSGEPLDVIFVVEVHQSFAVALEDLGEALYGVISKMPKATTRVGLVTYGEVLRSKNLGDPAIAARAARRIAPDDVPQPPVLVQALQKAVKMFAARPRPAGEIARKLIVVISDGNNEDAQDDATRDLFREVWKKARDAGVVIHTIGYTFTDARLPLKNLGEISKKTGGTFRWARARSDVVGHLGSVMAEIHRQMILTYFVPPDAVDGKPLLLVCRSAKCGAEPVASREIKPQPPRCAGAACAAGSHACVAGTCVAVSMAGTRGGGLWIWLLAGLVVAGGAGVAVAKRRRARKSRRAAARAAPQPGAPAVPGQPQPPAPGYGGAQVVLPDFSKIPYLANSPGVQQLQQQLANIPYVAQHMAAQAAQQAHPQVAAAPQARGAQLLVLSGPRQGQTLPLRHGFTVGRTPGCDLVIDDGMTSGHHAQFHFDTAGGVTIVDLGSTNGTYVNGVRQMQARLANGMALRIGQTEIRFLQG